MSEFSVYMQLGFDHIADLAAYDHILFIVALCAVYQVGQWREVLILVTAFTIGHSLTLAMATLGIFPIPAPIIEFLIPVTILVTALLNVLAKRPEDQKGMKMGFSYLLALFFGLIHGLGFSNYLRMLLGQEESLLIPLFSFNVGLELGQILIVVVIFIGAYVAMEVFKVAHREWNLFISGAAAGISLILLINTWIF